MGLKKIDIYIISHFVKNLLFALLCFIIIFILVDLFENLDKFIDNKLVSWARIKILPLFYTGNNKTDYTDFNAAGNSFHRRQND